MTVELYLAYVVAATGLILVPGPTMMLVLGYAVSAGARPALASMLGVVLGDLTTMTVSFLGLGAVLAASATLFTALKWAGAAYLVWLGVRQFRAPPAFAEGTRDVPGLPVAGMIGKAFLVTATNPKGIVFFSAFMPQFLDPAAPVLPQMALLAATFTTLSVAAMTSYVLAAARVRRLFASPPAMRLFNRIGGTLLVGAGVLTASLKRA